MPDLILPSIFNATSIAIKEVLKSSNKNTVNEVDAYWTKNGILIADSPCSVTYAHNNGIIFKIENTLSGVSVTVQSTAKTLPEDWKLSALEMCHAINIRAITPENHMPSVNNLMKIVISTLEKIKKEGTSWLIC